MKLPRHIAIIMDGNGRWAERIKLPRISGHKVGVESARAIIKICAEKNIEALTLFAFSTENWGRPEHEVGYLMNHLFSEALTAQVNELHKNNIRFFVIGNLDGLNSDLKDKIKKAEQLTHKNSGMTVVIALSYSGRWDITNAAHKICLDVELGKISAQDITCEKFHTYTCLSWLPEPDILIRTGGEKRISNFMLWQLAYTELYFTDVLWPDFREMEFNEALVAYDKRMRRFGR